MLNHAHVSNETLAKIFIKLKGNLGEKKQTKTKPLRKKSKRSESVVLFTGSALGPAGSMDELISVDYTPVGSTRRSLPSLCARM